MIGGFNPRIYAAVQSRLMSEHPAANGIGPLEHYNNLCKQKELIYDAHQEKAVKKLDSLYTRVMKNHKSKGIYMHAGVGRGKTMLMDLFCDCVPSTVKKQRVHYHEFMIQTHKKIFKHGGADDSMDRVAREIANNTQVLCLDELEIIDVADAFVTRSLFDKLWAMGVVTIFTTNCVPDALYKGGINRNSFLPFIGSVERNCDVICVDMEHNGDASTGDADSEGGFTGEGVDYRAASEPMVGTLFCPKTEDFDRSWDALTTAMSANKQLPSTQLNKRLIVSPTRSFVIPKSYRNACQFTFNELCVAAIGNSEYLALTDPAAEGNSGMTAVFVRDVPVLSVNALNDTRRFINLVDLLYERNILLVLSTKNDVTGPETLKPEVIFKLWMNELTDGNEDAASRAASLKGHIGAKNKSAPVIKIVKSAPVFRGATPGVVALPTDEKEATVTISNLDAKGRGTDDVDFMELYETEMGSNDPTFTHRAIARTLSRLNEMCGDDYLKRWSKRNKVDVRNWIQAGADANKQKQ